MADTLSAIVLRHIYLCAPVGAGTRRWMEGLRQSGCGLRIPGPGAVHPLASPTSNRVRKTAI